MINKTIRQMARIFLVVFITAIFAAGVLAVANIEVEDCCCNTVIPIKVTIADNVGSCDVMLRYDPEVVKVVGVRDGDMDVMTSDTTHRNEGVISIVAHQNPSSEGMYGTFVISNIVLESNTVGRYEECPIEIIVTEFREHTPAAKSMVYSTNDGMYYSECIRIVPGFLGVFAIAVILAAAYLIERRRRG